MRRCDRNRKRSHRRAIFCPKHGCHLDSVSQKHALFADRVEQLRDRGVNRKTALMLFSSRTTVALSGEWLEEFWCSQCQCRTWYHIHLHKHTYQAELAPQNLWQQAAGVIDPIGNPSVGEFTRNSAKRNGYQSNSSQSIRWSG
jgi:hypothetical protein